MEGCLVYLAIGVVILVARCLGELVRKARKCDAAMEEAARLRGREFDLRRAQERLAEREAEWAAKVDAQKGELKNDRESFESVCSQREADWERKVDADRTAIGILAGEKSRGFPWLAEAYGDYFHLQTLKEAKAMERKGHPAPRSAERVRDIARERRNVEKKLRIAQAIIKYYQELFPFLEDLLGDIDDELLKSVLARQVEEAIRDVADVGVDPVRVYLSEEEYASLSTAEKNQLALERYWERGKSKWEIGRNYERYVGYLYEREGYAVSYQGILEGFDDLGRDLICKKGQQTLVVQCKCWRQQYQIHEKHVNQLYGTTIKYHIEHPGEQAFAVLFTSTTLSDRAREFAAHLGVTVSQEVPLAQYPWVKCNVSRRTGELIYHLPFDQMYDRTLIEDERNERYAWTATEAEELGFRRAWRWKGEGSE